MAILDRRFDLLRSKGAAAGLQARQGDQRAGLATATGTLATVPLGASRDHTQRQAFIPATLSNIWLAKTASGDLAPSWKGRPVW
jgi:hypothetical protein